MTLQQFFHGLKFSKNTTTKAAMGARNKKFQYLGLLLPSRPQKLSHTTS